MCVTSCAPFFFFFFFFFGVFNLLCVIVDADLVVVLPGNVCVKVMFQ